MRVMAAGPPLPTRPGGDRGRRRPGVCDKHRRQPAQRLLPGRSAVLGDGLPDGVLQGGGGRQAGGRDGGIERGAVTWEQRLAHDRVRVQVAEVRFGQIPLGPVHGPDPVDKGLQRLCARMVRPPRGHLTAPREPARRSAGGTRRGTGGRRGDRTPGVPAGPPSACDSHGLSPFAVRRLWGRGRWGLHQDPRRRTGPTASRTG